MNLLLSNHIKNTLETLKSYPQNSSQFPSKCIQLFPAKKVPKTDKAPKLYIVFTVSHSIPRKWTYHWTTSVFDCSALIHFYIFSLFWHFFICFLLYIGLWPKRTSRIKLLVIMLCMKCIFNRIRIHLHEKRQNILTKKFWPFVVGERGKKWHDKREPVGRYLFNSRYYYITFKYLDLVKFKQNYVTKLINCFTSQPSPTKFFISQTNDAKTAYYSSI